MEMISYVNLAFLCLMNFYLLVDKKNQRIVAYISGSVMLLLFVFILFYHIIFESSSCGYNQGTNHQYPKVNMKIVQILEMTKHH